MTAGGLSDEDIRRLLAKPDKALTKSGKRIDLSIRTIDTWFAANHKLFDEEKKLPTECSNPDCPNPNRMCIEVQGKWVCRVCFLDGYLLNYGA